LSISGVGTAGNVVTNNSITLNSSNGVLISAGATNNIIGGANAISGNRNHGVVITGGGTSGNVVEGNFIGTKFGDGDTAFANKFDGVVISGGATGNIVGGTTAAQENIISSNGRFGVNITGSGTRGNTVSGNRIGTRGVGFGNASSGVQIAAGASGNTVGGTTVGARNVISGNNINGITIAGTGTSGNVVEGNFIGTDPGGGSAVPNLHRGILITGDATNNTIGGTTAGARNIISGNRISGVCITGTGTGGNLIEGNFIGLDVTGLLKNAGNTFGVQVANGANGNTIGGTTPEAGNRIGGNALYGVLINGANATVVEGNLIGTDPTGTFPLGNLSHGVFITGGAANNFIGGTAPGAGNVITMNGGTGVLIGSDSTAAFPPGGFPTPAGAGNAVLGNSIFANTLLGIDLGAKNGPTANDAKDSDSGPNRLQNFPVLTATISGTQVNVGVTLSSVPNTTFHIEIFVNVTADPSGFGEGQTFLGSINVTTDATGSATGTFSYPLAAGTIVTATATNLTTNDTSEFSKAVAAM
jgi:titin